MNTHNLSLSTIQQAYQFNRKVCFILTMAAKKLESKNPNLSFRLHARAYNHREYVRLRDYLVSLGCIKV